MNSAFSSHKLVPSTTGQLVAGRIKSILAGVAPVKKRLVGHPKGHAHSVSSLAFLSGERLVTASYARELKVWHSATGDLLSHLASLPLRHLIVLQDQDETLAALHTDGLTLLRVHGAPRHPIEFISHLALSGPTCMAQLPNRRQLAVVAGETLHFFHVRGSAELQPLRCVPMPCESIRCLASSPDGRFLFVTDNANKRVLMARLDRKKVIRFTPVPWRVEASVYDLATSDVEGATLLIIADGTGCIRAHELRDGKSFPERWVARVADSYQPLTLAVAGHLLACGTKNRVVLLDLASGAMRAQFAAVAGECLAVAADRRIAAGGNAVHLIHPGGGAASTGFSSNVRTLSQPWPPSVSSVGATLDCVLLPGKSAIRVFNLRTGRRTLVASSYSPFSLSRDGRYFVCVAGEPDAPHLEVQSLNRLEHALTLSYPSAPATLAVSEDALVAISDKARVCVYDLKGGADRRGQHLGQHGIFGASVDLAGDTLIVGARDCVWWDCRHSSGGTVSVYYRLRDDHRWMLRHRIPIKHRVNTSLASGVTALALREGGAQAAIAVADYSIRLLDLTSLRPRFTQRLQGHQGLIWSVRYAPGGDRLISGGGDGVRLWSAEGACLAAVQLPTQIVNLAVTGPWVMAVGERGHYWFLDYHNLRVVACLRLFLPDGYLWALTDREGDQWFCVSDTPEKFLAVFDEENGTPVPASDARAQAFLAERCTPRALLLLSDPDAFAQWKKNRPTSPQACQGPALLAAPRT